MKAGETVHQVGELPKTLRVSKIHYEPPQTVCKVPFASIFPPSMETGDGTRYQGRVERASGTMGFVDDEMQRRVAAADAVVKPSPATHAVLTVWKAGESVFQRLF